MKPFPFPRNRSSISSSEGSSSTARVSRERERPGLLMWRPLIAWKLGAVAKGAQVGPGVGISTIQGRRPNQEDRCARPPPLPELRSKLSRHVALVAGRRVGAAQFSRCVLDGRGDASAAPWLPCGRPT